MKKELRSICQTMAIIEKNNWKETPESKQIAINYKKITLASTSNV